MTRYVQCNKPGHPKRHERGSDAHTQCQNENTKKALQMATPKGIVGGIPPVSTADEPLRCTTEDTISWLEEQVAGFGSDVAEALIEFRSVFAEKVQEAATGRVTDNILDEVGEFNYVSPTRRGSHWLCELLAAAADATDINAAIDAIGHDLQAEFRAVGDTQSVALVKAVAFTTTLKLFKRLFIGPDPSTLFRVLIALVCPDLEQCPENKKVLKTLMKPVMQAELTGLMKQI